MLGVVGALMHHWGDAIALIVLLLWLSPGLWTGLVWAVELLALLCHRVSLDAVGVRRNHVLTALVLVVPLLVLCVGLQVLLVLIFESSAGAKRIFLVAD